jgi:hypothetical protein
MPDIMTVLQNLPQATAPADEAVVAADVARGHRAVSRRRQQRIGFTAAAVAVVAGVAVGAGQLGSVPTPATTATGGATATAAGLKMVAFTGDQPAGFKVTTVPDGWTVISSQPYEFVVAPPGRETGGGPSAGPSTGPAPVFYDGRIAVYLQGDGPGPRASHTEKVDINGKQGTLGAFPKSSSGPDAHWLTFPSAHGTVVVQVPDSTGLSNDQILTFARGVTVTDAAK